MRKSNTTSGSAIPSGVFSACLDSATLKVNVAATTAEHTPINGVFSLVSRIMNGISWLRPFCQACVVSWILSIVLAFLLRPLSWRMSTSFIHEAVTDLLNANGSFSPGIFNIYLTENL